MGEKENRPFSIAKRPAKPRKIRLNFAEGLQSNPFTDYGAGQDMNDEEVYSLCKKFSSASIRYAS